MPEALFRDATAVRVRGDLSGGSRRNQQCELIWQWNEYLRLECEAFIVHPLFKDIRLSFDKLR